MKSKIMNNALVVIDIQNDYFPGGAFTLEHAEAACKFSIKAIEQAKQRGWLVVGVYHLNPPRASMFASGTKGANIHPTVVTALGDSPIIVKHQADSFFETDLEFILQDAAITGLYLTGMMTQHCLTHTALSPKAQGMEVNIFAKGCAAPTQALSDLALKGLSARCNLV